MAGYVGLPSPVALVPFGWSLFDDVALSASAVSFVLFVLFYDGSLVVLAPFASAAST